MNSLVNLCVTLSAWGCRSTRKNLNNRDALHVLSNITDTSYLIGDGTGRGSAAAKYFVFESDEYERHFMPYHPEYSIITNIDFDHPDYFTSLEDVFNAFNDYAKQIRKDSSSTEKTKNCVGLPHQRQFITMVLIRRRTILWQATCFVQRLVQPSTFISVEKIWGSSISQHLVVTIS